MCPRLRNSVGCWTAKVNCISLTNSFVSACFCNWIFSYSNSHGISHWCAIIFIPSNGKYYRSCSNVSWAKSISSSIWIRIIKRSCTCWSPNYRISIISRRSNIKCGLCFANSTISSYNNYRSCINFINDTTSYI